MIPHINNNQNIFSSGPGLHWKGDCLVSHAQERRHADTQENIANAFGKTEKIKNLINIFYKKMYEA